MKIERIPTEHAGDWHDKPLKWIVIGPGDERQKFSTQAEARKYARYRRQANDEVDAGRLFINDGIAEPILGPWWTLFWSGDHVRIRGDKGSYVVRSREGCMLVLEKRGRLLRINSGYVDHV